ncbi:MAG: hypothetical protein O2960_26075 [Verrucomicrobia bacterium]|nr:hypothetical protein [Verrucomicrobiota bacterium]
MPKHEKVPEAQLLRRIGVRLILPEERERFDQRLEDDHYLHSARLGGQSLHFVAEIDGQWVALITFSGMRHPWFVVPVRYQGSTVQSGLSIFGI